MIQRVRKAVFPAAGLGTRFLPATKAQPKEMLPVVDKPLIQYGVEEAIHSGVQNIIVVTGRGKVAIEDQAVNGYLSFYVWDIAFWDGENLVSDKPVRERYALVNEQFGGDTGGRIFL